MASLAPSGSRKMRTASAGRPATAPSRARSWLRRASIAAAGATSRPLSTKDGRAESAPAFAAWPIVAEAAGWLSPLFDGLHPGPLLVQLDGRGRRRGLRHAELLVQPRLDVAQHVGMRLEEVARVLATLPDALAAVAEPGAAFLDDIVLHGEGEEIVIARDPLAVEDVELHLAERRRHLVLHHLDARAASDDRLAVLDGADAADVE